MSATATTMVRGKVGEAVNYSSLVCRVAQAACKRWEKGEGGIFVGSTGGGWRGELLSCR